MTDEEADVLQQANAVELKKMAVNAAGMIQSLLLDLRSNKSFIELHSAESHRVDYVFKEGTPKHVELICKRLGLKVNGMTIEVPSA